MLVAMEGEGGQSGRRMPRAKCRETYVGRKRQPIARDVAMKTDDKLRSSLFKQTRSEE